MTSPLKISLLLLSLVLVIHSQELLAQSRTYQPGPRKHLLDHTVPPGRAGYWAGALGRATPTYFQRIKIQIEGGGDVTFFDPIHTSGIQSLSPAYIGFQVGHVYRLKISNIPEMPGVTVYPTIELIDRLHPPEGKEADFAIPVVITQNEIRFALNDRLVTKIIYLEQAQWANPATSSKETLRTETLPHHINLIAEADQRGRPLMIFRMGGRIPDTRDPNDMLGTRGVLQLPKTIPQGSAISQHTIHN